MRLLLGLLIVTLVSTGCLGAIDAKVKAIFTLLQAQLVQKNLVDLFQRGGSLDPAIQTACQNVPNAEIASFTCFIVNLNDAIKTAAANVADPFAILTYYKTKCNSDPYLNKAMAAFADAATQKRMQTTLIPKLIKYLPKQLQPIGTGLLGITFSGKVITQAQAQTYVNQVKKMTAATKKAIIAKLPSAKAVLNAGGAYNAPYNVILNNLPIVISNKAPTAAQKKNINAALVKMYKYAHDNAVEYVKAFLAWVRKLPLNAAASQPAVLANYRSGAAKLITNGKIALAVPVTQQYVQDFLTTPYQL